MIKVASYNIRKGVGTDRIRSPDRILHVLHEIDADVIALQEADRRFGGRAAILSPHHLADHSPWKAVPFGKREHSAGWHGNVLLVRKDATIADCESIHLPTLEPRGAVMADLRVNGTLVRIVGMHLDLSGLMRRRQADAIMAHLDASTKPLPDGDDGRPQRMDAPLGVPQEFRRAIYHRRDRAEFPCAAPGRPTRPHHGLARSAYRGLRRAPFARIAHRVRPFADLG